MSRRLHFAVWTLGGLVAIAAPLSAQVLGGSSQGGAAGQTGDGQDPSKKTDAGKTTQTGEAAGQKQGAKGAVVGGETQKGKEGESDPTKKETGKDQEKGKDQGKDAEGKQATAKKEPKDWATLSKAIEDALQQQNPNAGQTGDGTARRPYRQSER